MLGLLGALWGLGGVILLLAYAIIRLAPIALEAISTNILWYHWAILILNVGMMAYLEGYRGFQKAFSPRVVARAKYIAQSPNIWLVLFGPFFCMGYFHTSKRIQRMAIGLTIFIVILVILIRFLEQPWRGIIDAGVVVGLSWGVISLLAFSLQALMSEQFDYSPEVPIDEAEFSSEFSG